MTLSIDIERQRLEFLPGITEKLGWYIYALRDPRDQTVFYIGKGIGNRVYDHARSAIAARGSTLNPKRQLINAIHGSGHEVIVEIVRTNLRDEKTAYEVEAAVIDALQHAGSSNLDYQIAGHGHSSRGWSSLESLRHLAAEPAERARPPAAAGRSSTGRTSTRSASTTESHVASGASRGGIPMRRRGA